MKMGFLKLTLFFVGGAQVVQGLSATQAGRRLAKGGTPLKVHVATFNAGNSKEMEYSNSDMYNGLFKQLQTGMTHDDDLLILGFQEFNDDHDEVLLKLNYLRGQDGYWKARYDSGTLCHRVTSHYDTQLYVFAKSKRWKVQIIPYSSSDCTASSSSSSGCYLKNEAWDECGKVVNLLKFRLTSKGLDQEELTFCALNTHMSFAHTADKRSKFNQNAYNEAVKAGCDAFVYVGDFNTRLHCGNGVNGAPLYAQKTSDMWDALQKVFYDTGPSQDELQNMLQQDQAQCYEKDGSSWKLYTFPGLKSTGMQEVGKLDMPSYKMIETCDSVQQASCMFEDDGKFKHRPAYTDRVLTWTKDASISVATESYNNIHTDFTSDHWPVVARLTFQTSGYRTAALQWPDGMTAEGAAPQWPAGMSSENRGAAPQWPDGMSAEGAAPQWPSGMSAEGAAPQRT